MFPCNTVKFLKDPSGWIKEMNNDPVIEKIDVDIIRARSMVIKNKDFTLYFFFRF
jgi:hypothetical protein